MDLPLSIIERIKEMPEADSFHAGEVIPKEVTTDFVWLMKSGESYSEQLCHPPDIDSVTFDIEIVSENIDDARRLTSLVKDHLFRTPVNSITFENDALDYQYIHGIEVDDHDDEYLPRSVGSDEQLHVGALDVTVTLGDLI